jgi:hypothetical protein
VQQPSIAVFLWQLLMPFAFTISMDVFFASSEIGSGGVCCHLFSTSSGWKENCIKIEMPALFH